MGRRKSRMGAGEPPDAVESEDGRCRNTESRIQMVPFLNSGFCIPTSAIFAYNLLSLGSRPSFELLIKPGMPIVQRHLLTANEEMPHDASHIHRISGRHHHVRNLPGLETAIAIRHAEDLGGVDRQR